MENVIVRKPKDCSEVQIADFCALVLAGGEVIADSLETRVKSAAFLVYLYQDKCLSGIAAIKNPGASYRRKSFKSAGEPIDDAEYVYELGWIFIMPSARKKHLSIPLIGAALNAIGTSKVFATAREANVEISAILQKKGFVIAGKPYKSGRGNYNLVLLKRP